MKTILTLASLFALSLTHTTYAADSTTAVAPTPAYSNQTDQASSNSTDQTEQESQLSDVKSIASLSEGSHVMLEGNITRGKAPGEYLLQDETGTIPLIITTQLQPRDVKSSEQYQISGTLKGVNQNRKLVVENVRKK